jgi:hypothetical protein
LGSLVPAFLSFRSAVRVGHGRSAVRVGHGHGFFIEGKKYRVNMFLATSFKREKAMEFARADYARAGNPPTMFIFHYSAAGCVHVNYIKSLIPEESEFLFPAFSAFTVRSTNFSSSTTELSEIHLDVAPDNLTESENLPLSPWH